MIMITGTAGVRIAGAVLSIAGFVGLAATGV